MNTEKLSSALQDKAISYNGAATMEVMTPWTKFRHENVLSSVFSPTLLDSNGLGWTGNNETGPDKR